ncbi:MAG: ABC transporter ATP-binding protein [Deltaproteobacteria bacterium]|nr:ABC transporter ATP-binding protein [Deltaproteobacteria bacterium]
MIQVEHLTKKYGDRTVVSDVGFHVKKGEIIGFLGPNGAGKTTTLRMLTGYLAPEEGTILIDGINAVDDPVAARKRIGYMPETVPLYKELRVEEYLRYRARLKEISRKQLRNRVESAMEMARITDVRTRIIGQLSRGYRSRVGLAEAIVADPPLLILDEPTAGLDPNQIRQVRNLIKEMAGRTTILLSTHILPEVESTCGRVLIIHRGKLVGEDIPGDLRNKGQSGQLLMLEGRGNEERFVSVLRKVAGVRRVVEIAPLQDDPSAPLMRVRVETDPSPEISEAVFEAVAAAGLKLRELHREQTSLEDVFAALTTEEQNQEESQGSKEEEAVGEGQGEVR